MGTGLDDEFDDDDPLGGIGDIDKFLGVRKENFESGFALPNEELMKAMMSKPMGKAPEPKPTSVPSTMITTA